MSDDGKVVTVTVVPLSDDDIHTMWGDNLVLHAVRLMRTAFPDLVIGRPVDAF